MVGAYSPRVEFWLDVTTAIGVLIAIPFVAIWRGITACRENRAKKKAKALRAAKAAERAATRKAKHSRPRPVSRAKQYDKVARLVASAGNDNMVMFPHRPDDGGGAAKRAA